MGGILSPIALSDGFADVGDERDAVTRERKIECKEIFSRVLYPVIEGSLQAKFKPYETKGFLFSNSKS